MSRDVPFDVDKVCDCCGRIGAYDFMGDFVCEQCLRMENKKVPDNYDADPDY